MSVKTRKSRTTGGYVYDNYCTRCGRTPLPGTYFTRRAAKGAARRHSHSWGP